MENYLKELDTMSVDDNKKNNQKKEPILDEDGNEFKLTLREICQGVTFWVGILALGVCAGARIYQEYKKHHEAPKVVANAQNQNINAIHSLIFFRTR